ncbi:hypothetical protein BE20_12400 [Sorangium cellulosum]|nr:hypothetical protein BE20_12400 [Sorangium cellulosum]
MQRSSDERERITIPVLTGASETWCTQLLEQFAWNADQPSIHGWSASTPRDDADPAPTWTERLKARAGNVATSETSSLEISTSHWEESERQIAFVLASLRSAMARETALPLPGGKVMIHLANGVFAHIHLRAHAATRGQTTASLVQVAERSCFANKDSRGAWLPPALCVRITTHVAVSDYGRSETEIGVLVPRGVHLAGHGLRADLVFCASPLFHASAPSSTLVAAAAERAAARRRADDDD